MSKARYFGKMLDKKGNELITSVLEFEWTVFELEMSKIDEFWKLFSYLNKNKSKLDLWDSTKSKIDGILNLLSGVNNVDWNRATKEFR